MELLAIAREEMIFSLRLLGTLVCILTPLLAIYALWPLQSLPEGTIADHILVLKHDRKLLLLKNGQTLRIYQIVLGRNPIGNKIKEGDGKTPEGFYWIDHRNSKSQYHLSLHISYPSASDIVRAKKAKQSPGGMIMIHGIRNGFGLIGRLHRLIDWTNGCMALTDAEIEEIWRVVLNRTPIEIRP